MLKRSNIGIVILFVAVLIYGAWAYLASPKPCDPQEATLKLANLKGKGILGVQHPPSMSNLLWIHIGPEWRTLNLQEKKSLDRIVRCAAQTTDAQGQTSWQAAYYDQQTGKLVALTSKQYGFRVKQN